MDLNIQELKADFMLDSLLRGETDAGIAISDNIREGILEIPLYTEKFYVYLAESCWRKLLFSSQRIWSMRTCGL